MCGDGCRHDTLSWLLLLCLQLSLLGTMLLCLIALRCCADKGWVRQCRG